MSATCNSHNSHFSDYRRETPAEVALMGPEERWFSIAAGGCLIGYGLSRLRLGALAALAVGGYSVYRGASGACLLRKKLAEMQEQQTSHQLPRGDHSSHEVAPARERALREVDCVDEAAMESFPASDPPSYTGTTAAPSVPIQ